ncbi:hypothetical protein Taro_005665, partial [Colocasia esculenta]|nr:hypothetical protein [Colocasia esculenta]
MNTKSLMQEKLAAVDRQLIAVDRPAFLNSGITGTVCICRQTSCIYRQIHTVQQDDALSAAICRQDLSTVLPLAVDRALFPELRNSTCVWLSTAPFLAVDRHQQNSSSTSGKHHMSTENFWLSTGTARAMFQHLSCSILC